MPPFRVAFVPGVTVSKWARVWAERHPDVPLELTVVESDSPSPALASADVLFARLPIDDPALAVIPLYTERQFVVVPRDHAVEAADEVTLADLAGEVLLDGASAETVALVAANVGVAVMPQSLARLHARRDVVSRPVTDALETGVGLVWVQDATTDRIEDFIGIVRGRTARSSRGIPGPAEASTVATPAKTPPKTPATSRRPTATRAPSRGPQKRRRSR